jgi:hypothetical protein
MSAQQDVMTAAVDACEAAIEQLVQARTEYETAYRAVAHSAFGTRIPLSAGRSTRGERANKAPLTFSDE